MTDKQDTATPHESVKTTYEVPQEESQNSNETQPKEDQNKRFAVNDFLLHEENGPVIKTFLRFSFAMALGPIAAFYGAQHLVVSLKLFSGSDGVIAGVIVSLTVILSLMAAFAYHAYQEEKRDYFAQHPEDTRPVFSKLVLSDKKSQ